jgi:D-inositol-3-phosphate glycosyltransferase
MRILFVLENYIPHIGGVEIVFKNLCERLAKKGHIVTVITHQLPHTRKEETINGVRVLRVPCFDSRYIFTFAAVPRAIKEARNADIIHTTTYNGAFPAWIAAVSRKKPTVITIHETWLGHWKEYSDFRGLNLWLHEFLEWCVYHIPRFDRYVCISESTRRMLGVALPTRKKQLVKIYNGFDPAPWKRKIPTDGLRKRLGLEGKFVIFAYGRPGTSKGFQYLIDAYAEIKRRVPNAALVLKMSRDKQYAHIVDEMQKAVPDAYFADEIKTHEQLISFVRMADCVVVPSITEGFGYVVLEASASGTPLVATNTTSIPEVIYGKHVLVRPKSAKAIADGVVAVSRGKYKTTKPRSFPWSRTIAEYEKVYKELLR